MGRPRTPTAVLELTGAFKKDPQRRAARTNEPAPEGDLGPPPKHFNADLAAVWKELAATCPAGVLTSADRWLVELACSLMLNFRRSKGLVTGKELSQLVTCLSRMGMTPADRSRVGVKQKDKAVSEFERLALETRPN